MKSKQVIVVRHDLVKEKNKVRIGKMMAQVAHASLGSLLELFDKKIFHYFSYDCDENLDIDMDQTFFEYKTSFGKNSVLNDWLNGKFTKIVVYVNNEEELLALNKALDETHIAHKLIIDSGLTEFHGAPTPTCLGIGPYVSEELDKFTGNLPLL